MPEEALAQPEEEPVEALPEHEPDKDPAVVHAAAIRMLGLLQKEGRLLDFFQEEIDAYADEQIGAAVRNIHRDCRRVLLEHVGLEPVMPGAEDGPVTVEAGFDPSQVRLIGNVTGEPPFSGTLRHHGWRAARIRLTEVPEGHDPAVIAPAEVEL